MTLAENREERVLELFIGAGEGDADVLVSAEGDTGNNRDAGIFEQVLGELEGPLAIAVVLRDVGKGIEGASL